MYYQKQFLKLREIVLYTQEKWNSNLSGVVAFLEALCINWKILIYIHVYHIVPILLLN